MLEDQGDCTVTRSDEEICEATGQFLHYVKIQCEHPDDILWLDADCRRVKSEDARSDMREWVIWCAAKREEQLDFLRLGGQQFL